MWHSKKKESLIIFLCLSMVVMAIEFAAFHAINNSKWLVLGALTHVCLVISLLALVLYRIYKCKNYRFSMLLLLMVSATGPFGAGVCLLASIGYLYCSGKFTPPEEWIENLLSSGDTEPENNLQERIAYGLDDLSTKSGVEPFQDVFHSGTMVQKQIAIAKITRYFQPQLASLLLQAAQDHNAAVRVQAAAALAKIEHKFMKGCMQLEKEQKGVPPDDASWLRLARMYEDYASAGLIDEYSLENLRNKAIKIYESYLVFSRDEEVQSRLARLYISHGQSERAYKILGAAMESGEVIRPLTLFLYTESLFYLKKFSEIRLIASHYMNELSEADTYKYGVEIEEAMCFWKMVLNNTENTQSILEKNYAT